MFKSDSLILRGKRVVVAQDERIVMAEPVISAMRLSKTTICHQSRRRCSTSNGDILESMPSRCRFSRVAMRKARPRRVYKDRGSTKGRADNWIGMHVS